MIAGVVADRRVDGYAVADLEPSHALAHGGHDARAVATHDVLGHFSRKPDQPASTQRSSRLRAAA